jgi:hypothetical protein
MKLDKTKRKTRKAGSRGKHSSMHETHTFDMDAPSYLNELKKQPATPNDAFKQVIKNIEQHIQACIEFLNSRGINVKQGFDPKQLSRQIRKNSDADSIPYATIAADAIYWLDQAQRLISNGNQQYLPAMNSLFAALDKLTTLEIGKYENLIIAGTKCTTDNATDQKKENAREWQEVAQEIYTEFIEKIENKEIKKKDVYEEIYERLKNEHNIERSTSTIKGHCNKTFKK